MAVVIEESKMQFGGYSEDCVFQIEQSPIYTERLKQNGIKSCEFILLRNNKLLFVEAKTSCPNQLTADSSEEKRRKYEEYIHDISEKMRYSLALYSAMLLGTYDSEAIPPKMREQLFSDKEIRFVLVVKNAEKEWLVPFRDKFAALLKKDMKIWRIPSFVILNEEQARERKLIL